jgi:hypothetical protein
MPIHDQPRRWRESSLCCLPSLVTSYQVFVRHLFELPSARPFAVSANPKGLTVLSLGDRFVCALGGSAAKLPTTNHISLAVSIYQTLSSQWGSQQQLCDGGQLRVLAIDCYSYALTNLCLMILVARSAPGENEGFVLPRHFFQQYKLHSFPA